MSLITKDVREWLCNEYTKENSPKALAIVGVLADLETAEAELVEVLECLEGALGYCPGYFLEKWSLDAPFQKRGKFVPSYDGWGNDLRKQKIEGHNK